MSCKRWLLSVGLTLVLAATTAEAQISTGGVRGIVKDETGAVLVGVTVEASSPDRIGPPAVEVTNNLGLYRFEGLPVGVYTVTFNLQSFTTIRRENVRVEVGRSTQLDLALPLATAQEVVTVTAESPVIDAVRAGYSTNFNQQLVENVPTARASYFDLITYAPGVKSDQVTNISKFIIYGSNADQNSYQMDGVDVAAPSWGSPWDYPNFDIMKEVEVLGVGASAEYSGFQGGVVNIVTKSGSNRWGGAASFFLVDEALIGNNTPDEEFPFNIDYQHNFTFQLGGPIVKDRLWVMGIIEATRNRNSQVGVDPEFAPRRHVFRDFFKVNAQFSDRDYFEFMQNDNNFWSPNQASRTRPPHTINVEHGHNPVISTRWTHTFGPATLLEVKGGGIYIRDRVDPLSEDFETPGRFDFADGAYKVNSTYTWRSHQNKTQMAASLTHYADDFIKGAHDFKFGLQLGRSTIKTTLAYFDNVYYVDYAGPYYAVFREPYALGARINTAGGFVQDNWTVNDRVTLNLGVRYDHTGADGPEVDQLDSRLENETEITFPGIPDLISFNNVSPRVGLTVKVDNAGKTVAKTSYGRYYGKLSGNMFHQISRGNTPWNTFLFNPETGNYDIPFYSIDFNFNYGVDPNLKNQYTDQFFVGIEREILPDFGLEASFIYKKENDFIRVRDVRGEYAAQPFLDTFSGETLTVFNRTSPSAQSLFQVTNRDDFDHNYRAFVLQAYKRWSKNWQLHGSYQIQRGEGFARGTLGINSQDFNSLGRNAFGRDPNDLINAFGRLPSDSTHSVKLSTTYEAPHGFHVGLRYSYESGRPYGRIINVTGLRQGVRPVLAEQRGAYSLPEVNDFQIRIDKDFDLGGPRRLRLSIDIYNVFNSDTFLTVRNNSSEAGANFGQPLSVVDPRRAMVGFRFLF